MIIMMMIFIPTKQSMCTETRKTFGQQCCRYILIQLMLVTSAYVMQFLFVLCLLKNLMLVVVHNMAGVFWAYRLHRMFMDRDILLDMYLSNESTYV